MIQRRRRFFEPLEQRCVLAAGLVPIDLLIPLASSEVAGDFNVDGNVAIKLSAMVLDPRADDASDVSLTGYDFSGTGTFSGPIDGVVLSGSFITDAIESPNNPLIPIQVNPSTQTIDFVLTQFGTFEASSEAGPISGTFTIVAELTLNFTTREARGQTTSTFTAAGRVESNVAPVQIANAIPDGIEFPDASKPFVSGRVFHDADDNGTRQSSESGVEGIQVTQLADSSEVASVESDANGYYSFYNIDRSSSSFRFRQVPGAFDFGKMHSENDTSIDSDADSRTGITPPIQFGNRLANLNIDAALRSTPHPWQNPNVTTDVNNDGKTTASDALAIINLLSQHAVEANSVDLTFNRDPGEAFYDVDGNGLANASDALAVIFGLYADSFVSGDEQEYFADIDRIAKDRVHASVNFASVNDRVASLF